MEAFKLYHPNNNEENDYIAFCKLRNLNYNHLRRLFTQQILNEEDYIDIGKLINECNYEELKYAKEHLNKIKREGARVHLLANNISKKPRVPYQRKKNILKEVNEDTLRKDYWINKGKRYLRRRVKNGKMSREVRDNICRETKTFKTSIQAQEWCENIIED